MGEPPSVSYQVDLRPGSALGGQAQNPKYPVNRQSSSATANRFTCFTR